MPFALVTLQQYTCVTAESRLWTKQHVVPRRCFRTPWDKIEHRALVVRRQGNSMMHYNSSDEREGGGTVQRADEDEDRRPRENK